MSHYVHSKLQADNAYSHDGKTVVIKGHASGVTNHVTGEELEHLSKNEVFKLHKQNGFITISDVEKEEESSDETSLLGSDVQPVSFELADDSVLQLSDVVKQAFEASGMTAEKWNSLKQPAREKRIAAVVDSLELKE